MNRVIDTSVISYVTQITTLNNTNLKDDTPYKEPAFSDNASLESLKNLEVAGLCVSKRFITIVSTRYEVLKYMFEEQELIKVRVLPLGDTPSIESCTIFGDLKGYHCIIKINLYYFYVNLKHSFVKILAKLSDCNFTSVAFNETNSTYNSSGLILLGSSQGVIYGYSIDYDHNTSKLTEKDPQELLKLKTANPIFGIAVSPIINTRWKYIQIKM